MFQRKLVVGWTVARPVASTCGHDVQEERGGGGTGRGVVEMMLLLLLKAWDRDSWPGAARCLAVSGGTSITCVIREEWLSDPKRWSLLAWGRQIPLIFRYKTREIVAPSNFHILLSLYPILTMVKAVVLGAAGQSP